MPGMGFGLAVPREDQLCQISIYKIDPTVTLDQLDASLIGTGYRAQQLDHSEIREFQFRLYHTRYSATHLPDWKKILKHIAKSDQPVVAESSATREGFVLLLHKSSRVYAVTGGVGFHAVQDKIDTEFGIDVISRMIRKEDKIIKTAREKSVIGSILGMTKHFRTNYNLFENDEFGKIYHELETTLDKQILIEKFGFTQADLKKELVCIAKSSFRIKKKISFEQVLHVIEGCESLLETEQTVIINSVRKLASKDGVLIDELDQKLIDQLWGSFSGEPDPISFDLCHRDFEKYLTATKYIVRKGSRKDLFEFDSLRNVKEIFEKIRQMPDPPSNQSDFYGLVDSLSIYSFDEDNDDLTHASLKDHLFGDVSASDSRKYFFIDGHWYQIKDAFIEELNESCAFFIKDSHHPGLGRVWLNSEDENEYSRKEIGQPNSLVLDRITPENIEPCDLLKWDDENLYLFHIKKGFGNTMRDLCSQVYVAANRISRDLRSGEKSYVRNIYSALRSKIGGTPYFDEAGRQTNSLSEEDFVRLFDKKLSYVLAVSDQSNRDIRNVHEFASNIAKVSLQLLSKEMKGIDAGLRICQIQRETASPR